MAKEILAAKPLSNNDIRVLSRLLKHQYESHRSGKNPNSRYIRHLMVLVGLGFTAILEDGALVLPMRGYLDQFLLYLDPRQKENSFSVESLAAARIIGQAVCLFHRLRYPPYYRAFKKALQEILEKGFLDSAKRRGEAGRLMALMLTH